MLRRRSGYSGELEPPQTSHDEAEVHALAQEKQDARSLDAQTCWRERADEERAYGSQRHRCMICLLLSEVDRGARGSSQASRRPPTRNIIIVGGRQTDSGLR